MATVKLKLNKSRALKDGSYPVVFQLLHQRKKEIVYTKYRMKENEFIKSLIELLQKHGCKMEDILNLFHKYSDNIITENMDNGEFDILIRFEDKPDDPYYYCFKDEGCHIIYHRFLKEDYEDFGF